MIKNWFKNIGPGPLIAAAFIGPGTVTVCTLAGVNFGFSLLWAMMLSIFATIVLQEMSARLGIITQKGLSEIIRTQINNPVFKFLAILLMLSAIVIGNAAYEAGNITGGVLGLETIVGNPSLNIGDFSINLLSIIIGGIAFVLLYLGNYKILEKALVALVVLMSLAFIMTAIITKPNISEVLKGAFIPQFPKESLLYIIALIGTTVVPYNLFLHAALVKEKWKSNTDLQFARKDTIVAVILGGLVSMCIIISAASIQSDNIKNTSDLAKGLEPLFGSFAKYFLAIGLFAAGITSSITAPLAAAYVATGCLGWSSNMRTKRFRAIWMFILVLGVLFSSLGIKPIDIIKFAQVANGILLPVISGFLIWIMNKESVLGVYKNTIKQNVFGFFILGISILLSLATLNKVFGLNLF
ncbi:NRAMP (natural resistance-associated macrophage protein) metal ion transporters [Flaviramulus basaltis]|uniref:NRAMP (Natural resistance-associated macrophage protein) metal ion transporters n=1 Tax=Flaviramulus basaltis TaxID=369401 RepID=A0A1K2IPN1_9FLAO|nr:Nramp family divalent metal transporter [Flaviramulus basaltis]SFZ94405.1 NRAMP (natural resistance-associated macrophage protein) metal ion transporters [Flaviramulus basaltis]